jgi:hypothetical protein
MTSTNATGIEAVIVHLEATTSIGVGVMTARRITVHPPSPIQDLKGEQKVTGCLAARSHFISRLGEKVLPLYRLLKKTEHFFVDP